MSLINEALKKAQNQRTVELTAAPSPTSPSATTGAQPQVRIAKRPPPLSARTLIGLIGGGVFGLLAVGVVSFFYFSAPATTPAAVVAKPLASTTVVKAPESGVTQAAPNTPNAAPPNRQIATVSLPPIPGAAPTGFAPAPFDTPPRPTPSPVPAAPVANPTISDLVDALRISVVRLTPTDPKVVLNGQVFRINDVVDRSLKVRLVKIEGARLVFSDANGIEYVKAY
jgi:hypothetical protein